MKTIEAKFYKRLVKTTSWKWIVIHCTQSKEIVGGAVANARWFAKPWNGKQWTKASAHFVVDNRESVQCVPTTRIAYHARGLNMRALGIELVGDYRQTRELWLDDYGNAMLALAAPLVASLASQFTIPLRLVGPDGMRRGEGGITTHATITRAFSVPGGHMDPGAGFPIDVLLSAVLLSRP
jgi:N-acetyl-anhydromuramyl-L-alanine amidase AmpD